MSLFDGWIFLFWCSCCCSCARDHDAKYRSVKMGSRGLEVPSVQRRVPLSLSPSLALVQWLHTPYARVHVGYPFAAQNRLKSWVLNFTVIEWYASVFDVPPDPIHYLRASKSPRSNLLIFLLLNGLQINSIYYLYGSTNWVSILKD